MTIVTGDNIFSTATWIVDPVLGRGTHTTIQGAIDDASSGDSIFVRPGTYAEDITLKTGIVIFGYGEGTSLGGSPVLDGNINPGTSTQSTIVGFRFNPTSDTIFSDSGATTGTTVIKNCRFNGDNSNDIITCSNTGRTLIVYQCEFRSSSGAKVFDWAGASLAFRYTIFNSGLTDRSTCSAGTILYDFSYGGFALETSGTGGITAVRSSFNVNSAINPSIIIGGSGGGIFQNVQIRCKTAKALTVNSGLTVNGLTVDSSADPVIDGTGTLTYDSISVLGGSGSITTSTENAGFVKSGEFRGASSGIGDIEYYFKASDFDALETNFAPLVQENGSNAKILVRAFDDSTEEYVNFSLKAPSDIDSAGTVTFRVWMYAATAASSKNVALTFDHNDIDNSETWDAAYTSEDSGDIAIDATQDDITEATWTETVTNLGWSADDIVLCRLSRPNASANDLTGDLYVLAFAVEVPRA